MHVLQLFAGRKRPTAATYERSLHDMTTQVRQPLGLGEQASSFGERGIDKRLAALSQHADITGDRLLDIGCANGAYTARTAAAFRAVDAVDVEEDRLEAFRAHVRGTPLEQSVSIHRMSADRLAFDDDTFDVVTAIEVLEHVHDLDATLREIHRVLTPDGRFLVTTPNRLFPFETHGVLWRGRRYPPGRAPFLPWMPSLHRRLADARAFTLRSVSRPAAAAGFRLESAAYMMPPFDRSRVGQLLRPLTDCIERTPLRNFGMTLVLAFVKPRTGDISDTSVASIRT